MTQAEWLAAYNAARSAPAPDEEVVARPTVYRDVKFRSALEANWAHTLDRMSIEWEYERWLYRTPAGERYLPDFWLPAVRTFIEVKGLHMQRMHKPQELAEEVRTGDVIVLIGFPPRMISATPYLWEPKLQWRDPLRYDTRLVKCPECSGWQWMRAQLSRRCRVCDTFHTGLLAKAGEMPFYYAPAQRPAWMDAY